MRLILHPGFHKTGTSSLQASLAANRDLLAPYCRIVLEGELAAPLRYASRFCQGGDLLDLAGFSASFGEVCLRLTETDSACLVMSSEGLSGRTPGKNGIRDYGAAPPLARAMRDAARAVFGRKVDLTFLYTTRDAEPWLYSAWRHNLWGYRIIDDYATFCQTYAGAADFGYILDRVRAETKGADVINAPLERFQATAHGPAEAVFALLGLPGALRDGIVAAGPRNAGRSPEISAALLALNRSNLSDAALKREKAALLRSAADD